jgi:hypothetical protein
MTDYNNLSSENLASGAESSELNSDSIFAQGYQERNAQLVAKLKQPKAIFTSKGWQVHSHDLRDAEDALEKVVSNVITRVRDEYNLIIGTTSKNARQAANLYLLDLKEKAISSIDGDMNIEMRLEP